MDTSLLQEAAERLRLASQSGIACSPVRDLLGETDVNAAYAVQEINTKIRIKEGARVVGKKIGLTSKVIQQKFGIEHPDFGMLFNDKEVLNNGSLSVKEIIQPKVEAEIAFVLSKDLPSKTNTSIDILNAIAFVLPSIEIVGSRVQNWDISITDIIADNASASHFVIGHQPIGLDKIDLLNTGMEMYKGDALVSKGNTRDCLGSPINALYWLANQMASLGNPLKAGEVILTGSLGPFVDVQAGDNYIVKIEGMSEVAVSFNN